MSTGSSQASSGWIAGLVLCLIAAAAAASTVSEPPAAECARLRQLTADLSPGAAPEAMRAAIVEQLRSQAPIALLEGFWVSPLDLAPALAAVGASQQPAEASAGSRPLLALAFTDPSLREAIPLPFVGDFPDLPPSPEPIPRVLVLPLAEGADAVLEYLAPEGECLYFCLDPAEWDFDSDGEANAADPDDDGDGVADGADAYPYWPQASEGPREGTFYRGFTYKFSPEVAAVVLAAHDRLRAGPEAAQAWLLGPVAELGALYLLLLDCPAEPAGCPDPDDPSVHYVSRDPEACAVIRYRCEPGQVGFSSDCGCGCQSPGGPEERQ